MSEIRQDGLHHRLRVGLLIVALLLRLVYALAQADHSTVYLAEGGDSAWYLGYGYGLMSGETTGRHNGIAYDVSVLPTAPLYLMFVGALQHALEPTTAIIVIRTLQALMGAALCWWAYDLAAWLARDNRAGVVAMAAITFYPTFILEPALILTETLYLFLLTGGIWAYVRLLNRTQAAYHGVRVHALSWVMVGLLLGLATLTRAVLLLFPLGLVIHAWLAFRRQAWGGVVLMLVAYSITVGSWTALNLVAYNRFVIVSNQFLPALWRGAVANDASPHENDALLGGATHGEQAAQVITSDLGGFIRLRVTELGSAYLQPHGTVELGGESLRDLALAWLRGERLLGELINGEQFWPKLLIYLFHYAALLGGILGMWLTRRHWRVSLVYVGFIAYTTLLHLVVLALPRYIFPTELYWWVLAAPAWVWLWDKLTVRRSLSA